MLVRAVLASVAILTACRAAPKSATVIERVPGDRGVATAVTFERITIDDQRTYDISPQVESFSTYTGVGQAILFWEDRYVHIGVEGEEAVWIAGIGNVADEKKARIVYYAGGIVKRAEGRFVFFRDGTVLEMARDLKVPGVGKRVTAMIDADRDLVVEFAGVPLG